jgi:hypothetical protein
MLSLSKLVSRAADVDWGGTMRESAEMSAADSVEVSRGLLHLLTSSRERPASLLKASAVVLMVGKSLPLHLQGSQ